MLVHPLRLPGPVTVVLHMPCAEHRLAASTENAPCLSLPIHSKSGWRIPPLACLCGPGRGQLGWAALGRGREEGARLGPAPCGCLRAGRPAAPWSRPVLFGWPRGWARAAAPLGRAQPGQPAAGLQALGTGPSSGIGAHTDSAGRGAWLTPG